MISLAMFHDDTSVQQDKLLLRIDQYVAGVEVGMCASMVKDAIRRNVEKIIMESE